MKVAITVSPDLNDPNIFGGVDVDIADDLLSDSDKYNDLVKFLRPAFGCLAANLGYDPLLKCRSDIEALVKAGSLEPSALAKIDAIIAKRV